MQEVFEKIIDRLLEVRKKNKYELYDCRANIGIDQAEKIVNEVSAEYNNGWIPVSERLPEEHEASKDIYDSYTLAVIDTEWNMVSDLVMITIYDEEKDEYLTSIGYTFDGEWIDFSCDNEKVVAWKPLLEPYKNKGET